METEQPREEELEQLEGAGTAAEAQAEAKAQGIDPDYEAAKADQPSPTESNKKWRCANELMGYCTGEPEWTTIPTETTNKLRDTMVLGGVCKNDPKSCMKFRWLSEMIDVSSLPEPHLVETMTVPEPDKEKVKPKTKKAQKLEDEIAQTRMM